MSKCTCIDKCRIPRVNTPKTSYHVFGCSALKDYWFYYEEALSAWLPCPDKLADLIPDIDEPEVEIKFKRVQMSEDEFDNLP